MSAPTEAERVAAAQQQQDAAREQLAFARIHGNEAAGAR